MYLEEIESEIANENFLNFIKRETRNIEFSARTQNKIARYAVSDEEIKDFLFKVSLRDLCLLADKALMNYYPQSTANELEIDRTIDIIAQGMTKQYLTNKQKWCLASFIIFYMKINI